jgi:soluble lytic murein transglycosylase
VPVLERLWVANPTSPRSKDAASALLALGKPVENAVSSAGQALIKGRATTFERLKLFPEAVALRDLLPKRGEAPSAGTTTARDAFDAKDYPRAVALYDAMADKGPSARFHHALAASRTGDYDKAAVLYTALYERFPDHKYGDQASYKVGYLAYDKGDLARAVPLLRAHLSRYPTGNHGLEARWFVAWSLYRQGRLSESATAFDDLLAAGARSGLAAGATYWKARIAGQQGDAAAERVGLERVLRSWPVSGYAWFASQRLQTAAPSPKPAPEAPSWEDPRFDTAQALARVGLGRWAQEALAPLARDARAQGTAAVRAYAGALQTAGDFRGGQALVRAACPRPGQGDPVLQRLCWPRPLGDAVSPVARERALPPSLPFAIMTAESGLDPSVSSIAGARGLMQLMPFLGERLFPDAFPERTWQADLLFHPGMNTRLGVQELGNLMARYGDKVEPALPMVIAGYNAGSEPVDRWLAAHQGPLEADVWSENIGYTETRKYVRRVLGYLRAYELVYGD